MDMKTIWLVPLEKIETRYTYEWADHIPSMIERACEERELRFLRQDNPWHYEHYDKHEAKPEIRLVNIEGDMPMQDASAGAFINFASTNVWKSSQAQKIAEHFYATRVKAGDVFYFTDAWNPAIIQVRYMSDLLKIPVHIVGQWHAGWHDPNDFLGRNIDNDWAGTFEASLFHAIDTNLFTTDAYVKLFFTRLDSFLNTTRGTRYARSKILRCGYPNSYLIDKLSLYKSVPKENIILFPHRIAPEKQIEIFKDLEETFATEPGFEDYKFIVCQEKQLTKPEYHSLLGRSKMVFSAALQETYGIAQTEAVFAGAISLSPQRLSYSEMYHQQFLYPSYWTESFGDYLEHKEQLVGYMKALLRRFDDSPTTLGIDSQADYLKKNYIGDRAICDLLIDGTNK